MRSSRPALSILAALSLLSKVAGGSTPKMPLAFAGGFPGLGVLRGGWSNRPFSLKPRDSRSLCTRTALGARMSGSLPLRGGAPLEGDDNGVSPASQPGEPRWHLGERLTSLWS